MLRELRIRNFAVIEKLELGFTDGFVAFTGETGAGKSILIGALALALGGRARPEQVRSGASAVHVEARFSLPLPPGALSVLEAAGLSVGDELILRRDVPAGGKSRAYVNDRGVSIATLERVGRELVDIHGQHQHQSLLHPETHLDFLDGYGTLASQRASFEDRYRRWRELRAERAALEAREREKTRQLDFLVYQREEIEKARLQPGEDRELLSQREVLRHTERLSAAAAEAERLVYSGENPAAAAVHQAAQRLRELGKIDAALDPITRVLEECQIQLEEAGREIQDYSRKLESNPERLDEVEERLSRIDRLKGKYGDSVEEILSRLARIGEEIAHIRTGEERLAAIDRELPSVSADLSAAAAGLSRHRVAIRRELEEKVLSELELLGLRGSTFEVEIGRDEDPEGGIEVEGSVFRGDERGIDRVEFLLSANPGEPPKALARIASGGELSRIMLAIKSVLAEVDQVPTLVFDEVDIGIGGQTARLVGDRLRNISAGRQVLCVTHLPQIASLADRHYNISKTSRKGRAHVTVKLLEGGRRTEEVARMLGGRRVTAATRKHAAEMLQERN